SADDRVAGVARAGGCQPRQSLERLDAQIVESFGDFRAVLSLGGIAQPTAQVGDRLRSAELLGQGTVHFGSAHVRPPERVRKWPTKAWRHRQVSFWSSLMRP